MQQYEDRFPSWDEEQEGQAVGLALEDDPPAGADDPPAGADDPGAEPFGLYLNQMGSVPLLNRQEELELTGRLDRLRGRYRRAALCSAVVLGRVVETFERIRAGALPLERTIDVVPSLGLTAERVRGRLPRHLGKLRRALEEAREELGQALRGRSAGERARRGRAHRARLGRAVRLAEGLSPRTELLDAWTAELPVLAARLGELAGQG